MAAVLNQQQLIRLPDWNVMFVRDDRRLKNGCFFGKVPKGGEIISDPKNYIADFVGFKAVYFGKKSAL